MSQYPPELTISLDGGVFSGEAYRKETFALATLKQVTPQWHQIFLRAIGANWLVCMAAFLSFSARDLASKVIAIWWPTFAFVSLSLGEYLYPDTFEKLQINNL